MDRELVIIGKSDVISKLVIFALGSNLYVYAANLAYFQQLNFRGISIEGYFRFASIIFFCLIFMTQAKRIYYVATQESGLVFGIIFFTSLTFIQVILFDNKLTNIQGNFKFYLYFITLFLGLPSCYHYSKNMRDRLMILAVFFFVSVIVFYPYIIFSMGVSLFGRLQLSERYGLLLQSGNEDAHFMVSLLPLVIVKLHGKKLATTSLLLIFCLVLYYNGTRTTMVSGVIVTSLYYFLVSKRKIYLFLFLIALILPAAPVLSLFFSTVFDSERGLILSFNDLLMGDFVGGKLSARLTYLWLPTIEHTIRNSFWLGAGSNGWEGVIMNTSPWYAVFISGQQSSSPHSLFVWVFVSFGMIGLLLIIYLFYKIIEYTLFAIRNCTHHEQKRISVAILCSFVGYCIWCFIANASETPGWIILTYLLLLSMANKYSVLENRQLKNRQRS